MLHPHGTSQQWLPLSRSYGYILPSSLTRVLPRTLGFSPRIPVSVYGTGGSSLTRSFSRQHGSLEFDFTEVSSIYQFSVLYSTDLPILQPTTFDTHIHSRAQATFCVPPSFKCIFDYLHIFLGIGRNKYMYVLKSSF